ncbi:tRNA threonylcarbamoyl adenosine modification protein, Sua5/YciO/YrdC/YwlC family [Neorickettsia helminthoeca str. Oregon]|uniref:L-threonylcarbamoyladenylate synthase n=1 Tax=Neorickettsia helminthoeca str. Oregon TaxID=1286528 RepID=X5HKE1_9RICK|nr:L-threonylcarbamoyladenylate synthase [Neorickettsia helminthoeca]AHX11499.1 tRNA threonylcarbamoyl adenosine modification protein, Sua5/YciO/YrdC/YwlC family [Neorickettsia helminthoeca str. Oregon]
MIEKAVNFLRIGGVIIFPTETVYALACDASNYHAKLRIYRLKQRNIKKNLPVMVWNFSWISRLAELTEYQSSLIRRYSPGPVTFIVPRKDTSHLRFHFPRKIAVRIPDSKIALRILQLFNRPICATSVNISSKVPTTNFTRIDGYIRKRVDYIIGDNQGVSGTASSIVDISESCIVPMRRGIIDVTS